MIKNASSITLNKNSGTLPDVSSGIKNWFRPLIFLKITKSVVFGLLKELAEEISFRGVIQPFPDEKLNILSEGQRSWSWWQVHAEPSLILNTDDVIKYEGSSYRVMNKVNYDAYGYLEYHLVRDYDGSGPTIGEDE